MIEPGISILVNVEGVSVCLRSVQQHRISSIANRKIGSLDRESKQYAERNCEHISVDRVREQIFTLRLDRPTTFVPDSRPRSLRGVHHIRLDEGRLAMLQS